MAKLPKKYVFSCFLILILWMFERSFRVTIRKGAVRKYPEHINYLLVSGNVTSFRPVGAVDGSKLRRFQSEEKDLNKNIKDSVDVKYAVKERNLTIYKRSTSRKTNISILQRRMNNTETTGLRKDMRKLPRRKIYAIVSRRGKITKITYVRPGDSYLLHKNNSIFQRRPQPYSNFSYPLSMDFKKMYQEFSESGRSPHSPKQINPHPFNYTYLSARCKFDSNKNDSLLILVKSSVNNFHLRKSIRETWGNVTGKNIKVVYLLGYNENLQPAVDDEAKEKGDIIQESFIDAYLNNTYKTIMGFNWAVQYCRQAKYLLFVDDDHFLILPNIIKYINGLPPAIINNLFAGFRIDNGYPYRDYSSKWYISMASYPFETWPPYLKGGAFILSRDALRRFQFSFPFIKFIGIDDSYLGIVASKLGIDPQHVPSFNKFTSDFYKDMSHFAYHDFKSIHAFKNAMKFYQSKYV